MPRISPRSIEQHYFEQFRRHFALPPGRVEYADKPDVRVVGERTTGIEIARLYIAAGSDPRSEQVQARRREQVIYQAQQLHRTAGGRAIELHVDFDPAHPIVDVPSTAERLAKLALEVESNAISRVGDLDGLAKGLRYFNHNGVEYPDAKWRNVQVFTTPMLNTARLESVVAEKAEKAAGYDPCDELWLLLVVDFMDSAQDQELQLPPRYRLPSNPFGRVLLYKPQFGQIVSVAGDA